MNYIFLMIPRCAEQKIDCVKGSTGRGHACAACSKAKQRCQGVQWDGESVAYGPYLEDILDSVDYVGDEVGIGMKIIAKELWGIHSLMADLVAYRTGTRSSEGKKDVGVQGDQGEDVEGMVVDEKDVEKSGEEIVGEGGEDEVKGEAA